MKRVWALYRVSSWKQVTIDDDIPSQKEKAYRFIKEKTDWKLTRELSEKGISGYSTKVEDREGLKAIRRGAINKDFDVLLIEHFDRLGRKEEIALIVHFLIEQGIEVWSVLQGQRTIENHNDRLLNYLEFWLSQGESEKISMKVRTTKKNLSEQGFYQGGPGPIGYKVVDTNTLHSKKKGVYLKELEVDNDEKKLVELVFSLYIDKHMGYRKIVDYLNTNGYRGREGDVLGVSTIQRMLSNPIYIGKKRYRDFEGENETQPYNEKLRIISDERFYEAEKIRTKRRNKLQKQDKDGIPLAGKLMFSGIAHCYYCGSKLSGNYLYRKYKYKDKDDRTTAIYRYRCPLNKGRINCNHEQNIWGAKKYDRIILEAVKNVLSQIDLEQFKESSVNHKQSLIEQKEKNLSNLEKELAKTHKDLGKLQMEIIKSLNNESNFKPDMLTGAIEQTEEKKTQLEQTIKNLNEEIDRDRNNYSDVNFMANELNQWEQKFDSADDDLKKAMLSRVVNKVYLKKGEVDLEFNLLLNEVLGGAE